MSYTAGIDLTFINNVRTAVGNETAALNIVQGLYNNRGDNSYILFSQEQNAEYLEKSFPEFRIINTDTGFNFYHRFLPRLLKKIKFDLIYYPQPEQYLNVKLKTSIVITSHGLTKPDDFFMSSKAKARHLRRVDKVVAESHKVKYELINKKKLDASKIVVIPNPLGDMQNADDLLFKKKHIVVVSNDRPEKNLLLAIKAFEEIANDVEHDLVIAGDVSSRGEAYKYIMDSGIANRVILPGRISKELLFGYYKNADLVLNTSVYEGFGLVPLEAMAFSVPVISTAVPSISEIDGIEFDQEISMQDSQKEVAQKMLFVLNNGKSEKYLEQRAKKIMDNFSMDSISREYIKVFEDV